MKIYLYNDRNTLSIILTVILSFLISFPLSFIIVQHINQNSKVKLEKTIDNSNDTISDLIYSNSYTSQVKRNILLFLKTDVSDPIPPFKIARSDFALVHIKKFSQCLIYGNMYNIMRNAACYMYDPDLFLEQNQTIAIRTNLCDNKNEAPGYEHLIRLLPFGYRSIVTLRNPLARFSIIFNTECRRGRTCFGCASDDIACVLESARRAIIQEPYKMKVPQRLRIITEISKFVPQTWNCRLDKIYNAAYFIKFDEEDTWDMSIKKYIETLEKFDMDPSDIDVINQQLMENKQFFRAQQDVIDRIRANPTLMKIFLDIYKYDYHVFGFTLPN